MGILLKKKKKNKKENIKSKISFKEMEINQKKLNLMFIKNFKLLFIYINFNLI
jgi:hypothetical protein